MCDDLKAELQKGNQLATALVDHLAAMGNASNATIPVVDRHEEYVVRVLSRSAHEQEQQWRVEDPRMLREQIRVADAAYQNLHERHEALKASRESAPSHYPRAALKLAFTFGLIAGLGLGSLVTFIVTRPPSEQVKRAQIEERQAVINALQGALQGLNAALERQRQPEPPDIVVALAISNVFSRPIATLAISNALSLGQAVKIYTDSNGLVTMEMSKNDQR